MLAVTDHPMISNPNFTTEMVSFWDGGLHFFEVPPAGVDSTTILGTYYFSYFLVFLVGWILIRRWVKTGSLVLKKSETVDLMLYGLLGVMLGAKIVYVLFYNLEYYLENPSQILLNWSGMASHGAFAGVLIAIWLFSRRFKRSFLNICDHAVFAAATAPIFVRMANFLNGELYGRSASSELDWAMRFPMNDGKGRKLFSKTGETEGKAGSTLYALVQYQDGVQLKEEDVYVVPVAAHHNWESVPASSHLAGNYQVTLKDEGSEIRQPIIVQRAVTDPSHPSQLYQLGVSGVLLLLVLIFVRWKARRTGVVFAAFLIAYGLSRIAMEFFRQPDPQRSGGLFEIVSMGQLLSLAVIGGGIAALIFARRTSANEPENPTSQEPEIEVTSARAADGDGA